jgi:hypothetical protein
LNWVDAVIILILLVSGYLGLRWGRSVFHLLVIMAAVFFSLCVASYFTYGALRLFPMLAVSYAVVLVIIALFALPLVTLFKTGTLGRVEMNFRWQPPLWLNLGGGALVAAATVAMGMALVMVCSVIALANFLLVGVISGVHSGFVLSIVSSGFTRGSATFIGWLAQTPGLVFFIVLGIAFIVLAIRGPKVSEGPVLKAVVQDGMSQREAERARQFFGDDILSASGPGMGAPGTSPIDPAAAAGGAAAGGAFSMREYYERRAREQAAPGPADVPTPPTPPPAAGRASGCRRARDTHTAAAATASPASTPATGAGSRGAVPGNRIATARRGRHQPPRRAPQEGGHLREVGGLRQGGR